MKKNLLNTILFLVGSYSSFAQQPWAQPMASWHYGEGSISTTGYIYLTRTGDTLLQNHYCDKYNAMAYYYDGLNAVYDSSVVNTSYTYIDNNKVYAYSTVYNLFYTLYDFGAQTGNSWYIYGTATASQFVCSEDSSLVTVDSANTVVINGDTLKTVYVSQPSNASWTFGTSFTERIGGNYFLFPEPYGCLAEVPLGLGLRCYTDTVGWFYQAPGTLSCDYINSIDESTLSKTALITANVSENILTFYFSESDLRDKQLKIYSALGQKVMNQVISATNEYAIPISDFSQGMYFWDVQSFGSRAQSGKFLVLK